MSRIPSTILNPLFSSSPPFVPPATEAEAAGQLCGCASSEVDTGRATSGPAGALMPGREPLPQSSRVHTQSNFKAFRKNVPLHDRCGRDVAIDKSRSAARCTGVRRNIEAPANVRKTTVVHVCGASGAGKSTRMKVLVDFLDSLTVRRPEPDADFWESVTSVSRTEITIPAVFATATEQCPAARTTAPRRNKLQESKKRTKKNSANDVKKAAYSVKTPRRTGKTGPPPRAPPTTEKSKRSITAPSLTPPKSPQQETKPFYANTYLLTFRGGNGAASSSSNLNAIKLGIIGRKRMNVRQVETWVSFDAVPGRRNQVHYIRHLVHHESCDIVLYEGMFGCLSFAGWGPEALQKNLMNLEESPSKVMKVDRPLRLRYVLSWFDKAEDQEKRRNERTGNDTKNASSGLIWKQNEDAKKFAEKLEKMQQGVDVVQKTDGSEPPPLPRLLADDDTLTPAPLQFDLVVMDPLKDGRDFLIDYVSSMLFLEK